MSFDPVAFEHAMSQIRDGAIFERFAQDLFCQLRGYDFVPIGGLHDRGIDGLDHCYNVAPQKTIFQFSIEKSPQAKIRKTLKALADNSISCSRLFYVTSRQVPDQDVLQDEFANEFSVTVNIRDVQWLRGNVNKSEGALRTYYTLIESYFHQFARPGASPIAQATVADLEGDPRLYVFLRQQIESASHDAALDGTITDTLILFALEGTDPDKKVFLKRDEIKTRMENLGIASTIFQKKLDTRLAVLAHKPRKINYHKELDAYCLPYETRLELEQKNLIDNALYTAFREGIVKRIETNLATQHVRVLDPESLVTKVISRIFKQQGLEFSQFLQDSKGMAPIEKSLSEIVSDTVDDSAVIPKNRDAVKAAILATIRDLIYYGSRDESEYLRRLANTYVVLFLMQCDPKVATYFSVVASKLNVFVDNSIIVPALSELPLEPYHRRHWNLMAGAARAGVRMYIDKSTLTELASHLRRAKQIYDDNYRGRESVFDSATSIAFVDEILIRSFLYSRVSGRTWTFDQFLDQFATVGPNLEDELIIWLAKEFKVALIEEENLLDRAELDKLKQELTKHKGAHQAENDAKTILTIYALRARNKERAETGIFGFRTWWLSKDTLTHKAVEACFQGKYEPSCCMRPDFLYNYISLAPSYDDANRVFDVMFPSLLGVNVSHHIRPEVSAMVAASLKEHGEKSPARMSAILRTLGERLKAEPATGTREIRHYLDDELKKLAEEESSANRN